MLNIVPGSANSAGTHKYGRGHSAGSERRQVTYRAVQFQILPNGQKPIILLIRIATGVSNSQTDRLATVSRSLSFLFSGSSHSPISPNSIRQHSSTPPRPASASQVPLANSPPVPRNALTPPPQTLVRSSLVQSTSFLDSVPVTLTLEPRDWMSSEDGGTALSPRVRIEEKVRPPALQGFEVELKRRPGEGFGLDRKSVV